MSQLSERDIYLLEAFWEGTLSEPNQTALQRRLDSDAVFRQSADQLHATILGLQGLHERNMRQWMKGLDAQMESQPVYTQPQKWWKHPTFLVRAAAAAAVIVCVALFWPTDKGTPGEQAVAQVFQPYPGVGIDLSPGGEAVKYKAYTAYLEKNYAAAAPLFAAYAEANRDNLARFYSGISYLGAHQPKEAIDMLSPLRYAPNTPEEAVDWYLALAHVAAQQPEAAKAILIELKQKPGDFGGKAAAFLKDLELKKIL